MRGLLLAVFGGQKVAAQQDAPRVPMKEVYEDGAEARWLDKKVLESKVLDSMEDAATWTFHGDGDMALADSPVKNGKHSLRIRSTQNIGKVGGAGEWEDLIAGRKTLFGKLERLQPDFDLGLSRRYRRASDFGLPSASQ